jgi:hypothetical protein
MLNPSSSKHVIWHGGGQSGFMVYDCTFLLLQLYRTPFMLRYCVSVLIHLGSLALGPYFRHVARCDDSWELSSVGCPGPYIMACAYGVICNLLLSVQVWQGSGNKAGTCCIAVQLHVHLDGIFKLYRTTGVCL